MKCPNCDKSMELDVFEDDAWGNTKVFYYWVCPKCGTSVRKFHGKDEEYEED